MQLLASLWKLYEKIVRAVLKRVLGKKADDALIERLVNFADFCVVGALSAVVSLGCYYIVILFSRKLYLLGYSIGFVMSILNSYFWNSHFVFHKDDERAKTLMKTALAYGITFLFGNLLLYVMVEVLHISEFIAPIIQIAITTPVNYLLNRKWVYGK